MRNLFFAIFVLLATLFSAPTQAITYYYAGKAFQLGISYPISYQTYYVLFLAKIDTPTPLTAGTTLTPDMSFTIDQISLTPGMPEQHVGSPWPDLLPSWPPGSIYNPYLTPTLTIGAVDANGLPTVWDIGLDVSYTTPGGPRFDGSFHSSNNGDTEEYTIDHAYAYGASNGGGNWSLTPEPETYALLLAGLAIIGAAVKRKTNA